MNILIVEDQFSLADAMKATLEKESFNVTIATDGVTGGDEALSDVYDLIILDVMLPGKNGFDILRSVKTELDTPVIMVTAKGEIEDKLNGLEHGADDYITKDRRTFESTNDCHNLEAVEGTKETRMGIEETRSVTKYGSQSERYGRPIYRCCKTIARLSGQSQKKN